MSSVLQTQTISPRVTRRQSNAIQASQEEQILQTKLSQPEDVYDFNTPDDAHNGGKKKKKVVKGATRNNLKSNCDNDGVSKKRSAKHSTRKNMLVQKTLRAVP